MTAPVSARPRRTLSWVGAVESLSLLVLLLNLATVHLPGLASALGPIHGSAYLIGMVITVTSFRSWRVRLLSLVPAVGALLVVRVTRPAR